MSGKRSIFEEVETDEKQAAPGPVSLNKSGMGGRLAVVRWLLVLLVLLVVMILVGGLTRLTDSGLSITEWAPITGALPPMGEAAWQSEFEKYQAIPEFQLVNKNMTMAEFQYIYWWEWGHRQLGRLIGLVWAVGFAWFAIRRTVPRGWLMRLLFLGALGGLQGFIGWWMVSSGLEGQRVDVASYRLATHLGLAFVILGLIVWYVFSLRRPELELFRARRQRVRPMLPLADALTFLAFVQILLGALVAGLDAGRGYIDWPLMGGQFFPSESFDERPVWVNFFENEALTQFNHRIAGYLLAALAVYAWVKSRRTGLTAVRGSFQWVLIFVVAQAVWGIVTVINAAPLSLAIVHQLGAIAVWFVILRARFEVIYPGVQSVRG